ncbi:HYC_CC_PP family protein [Flexithrix dorotheae]|uniref:HYC_CC_PP family protein n=1 Tax=Flexithrix dorotheae TaxID=70993 RepID=UPI000360BF5E|nr:hypothetical protein [Flexithrix dorotheae]
MKKILSIFLTFLLLISQVGLTMATHYCAGEAVESQLMLVAGHIGCGMEEDIKEDCENLPAAQVLQAQSCCDSDFQVFQNDEDLDHAKSKINLNLSISIIFIQSFYAAFISAEEQVFYQPDYPSPPRLKQDFQVLFQTFLI